MANRIERTMRRKRKGKSERQVEERGLREGMGGEPGEAHKQGDQKPKTTKRVYDQTG